MHLIAFQGAIPNQLQNTYGVRKLRCDDKPRDGISLATVVCFPDAVGRRYISLDVPAPKVFHTCFWAFRRESKCHLLHWRSPEVALPTEPAVHRGSTPRPLPRPILPPAEGCYRKVCASTTALKIFESGGAEAENPRDCSPTVRCHFTGACKHGRLRPQPRFDEIAILPRKHRKTQHQPGCNPVQSSVASAHQISLYQQALFGFLVALSDAIHLSNLLLSHNPAATISRTALTLGNPPLCIPLIVKAQFGIGFDVAAGNQTVANIGDLNQIAIRATGMVDEGAWNGRFQIPFIIQVHGVNRTIVLVRADHLTGDFKHQFAREELATGENATAEFATVVVNINITVFITTVAVIRFDRLLQLLATLF